MEYLKKSFTVAPGKSDAYRNNWDAVFGSPKKGGSTMAKKKSTKKGGGKGKGKGC